MNFSKIEKIFNITRALLLLKSIAVTLGFGDRWNTAKKFPLLLKLIFIHKCHISFLKDLSKNQGDPSLKKTLASSGMLQLRMTRHLGSDVGKEAARFVDYKFQRT
jgi:hypothetical protein